MKKLLLFIGAFSVLYAQAQDLTSKRGESILPQEGDWAVSIDATPFLSYAGQLLSNAGSTAPTWNFINPTQQTIIGKYFVTKDMAYRGILRIGFDNTSTSTPIAADPATATTFPAVPTMVNDKMSSSNHFIGLGAGIEKRRGKTRLQGFYGADAMIWESSNSTKYTYGNALSSSTTNPVGVSTTSTTNFGSNLTTDYYNNAARITKVKSGSTFGIGVRAFLGAEYFIFPKISIGGEFGWGIGYSMTGKGSTTTESLNPANGNVAASVGSITTNTSKSSSFMLDTDRNAFRSASGNLNLTLHF